MLPGSFPDSDFPAARNLRVRRWDQNGAVFRTDASGTPVQVQDLDAASSTGVIDVPVAATTLLLENGVTVAFASTGAKGFRAGDYWVFAARTADASVELLDRAPPRGIHHHYARLGIWDVGAGAGHRLPPSLAAAPAAARLQLHRLRDARVARQRPVHDPGRRSTRCARPAAPSASAPGQYRCASRCGSTAALGPHPRAGPGDGDRRAQAAPSSSTAASPSRIENLAILSLGREPGHQRAERAGPGAAPARDRGAPQRRQPRARRSRCRRIVAGATIATTPSSLRSASVANDPAAPRAEGDDQTAFLLTAALAIDDNVLWCARQAIALDGSVLHLLDTRIAGNERSAAREGAHQRARPRPARRVDAISGNSFSHRRQRHPLRASTAPGSRATSCVSTASATASGSAIALATGLDQNGVDQCQVLANQIDGFGGRGIVIGAPVRELIVQAQHHRGLRQRHRLHRRRRCRLAVDREQPPAQHQLRARGRGGIAGRHRRDPGGSATIAGNTIRSLGITAVQSALRAGILDIGVERARVSGNEVTELAPPGDFVGLAAGIMLVAPLVDFEVGHNRVERDAVPSTQRSNGPWQALVVLDVDPQTSLQRVDRVTTVRVEPAKTVVLGAGRPYLSALAFAAAENQPPGAQGSIVGNVLISRGDAPAVQVLAAQCLFNDNRVDARLNGKIAVTLTAPVCIVSTNRVTGNEFSIQINGATAKSATVLGNITTRGISLAGAGLPAPWDALNLRA